MKFKSNTSGFMKWRHSFYFRLLRNFRKKKRSPFSSLADHPLVNKDPLSTQSWTETVFMKPASLLSPLHLCVFVLVLMLPVYVCVCMCVCVCVWTSAFVCVHAYSSVCVHVPVSLLRVCVSTSYHPQQCWSSGVFFPGLSGARAQGRWTGGDSDHEVAPRLLLSPALKAPAGLTPRSPHAAYLISRVIQYRA